VRAADGFDSSSTGFFNTGMRANALSYLVGLHSFLDYPRRVLSADRNLRFDNYPVGCSSGVNNADAINPFLSNPLWTNAVHGTFGHALLVDGHVEVTSNIS
jgi:prepilin-type processing-associated H-X9-DG protein